VWHYGAMHTSPTLSLDKRHRFPAAILGHCVWLYDRVSLSDRDGEALRVERGMLVSYATVRSWCRKLGHAYAHVLRRRCPRPVNTWHLGGT